MRSIATAVHIGIAVVAYLAISPASAQQKQLQYKFDIKSLFSSDPQQDKKQPEIQPAAERSHQPQPNEKAAPAAEEAQSQNNTQDMQGSADTSGAASEWLGRFDTCLKAYESIAPGQSIDKADECVSKAESDAYAAGITTSVASCLIQKAGIRIYSIRSVWNHWMNRHRIGHKEVASCLNVWPYVPILAKLSQIDRVRSDKSFAKTQADATQKRESDIDARIQKLLRTP